VSDDVKGDDAPAKRPPRGSPLRRRAALGPRNLNGPKGAKLTTEQIEAALRATGGVMTTAADKLRVSRDTLYKRVRANKKLGDLRDSLRDETLDLSESVLQKTLKGRDARLRFDAAKYYLDNLGGGRGFGTKKVELSATPSANIQFYFPKKASLDEAPESADPIAEPVDDDRPGEASSPDDV
jgi:Bacterial regulatory protein, Fis family